MPPRDPDGPQLDDLGLNSVPLEELHRLLGELGEAGFRRRFSCSFLVLQHGPPRGDDWIDLNTSEASMPRPKDLGESFKGIRAIPLLKSERNAFGSKITVGRARNNDVIIRAPKISKLHSTFFPDDQGGYKLQDMGSLNGTVINGERLQKKEKIDLRSGDLVSFWRFVFEFISLDEMLARLTGR